MLSVILGGLPADFAVVMHPSPYRESILAESLDTRSLLPVEQARTGDFQCRSCVFVAPPNHPLRVGRGGRLKLSSSSSEKVHYARPSADPLFVSLAKVYRKIAIEVVLTGGDVDVDGSFGEPLINDEGGVVIIFANITVANTLEADLCGQRVSLEMDVAEQDAKWAKGGKKKGRK